MNLKNIRLNNSVLFKLLALTGIVACFTLQNCASQKGAGKADMLNAYAMIGGGYTELPYKDKATEEEIYVGETDNRVLTGRILAGLQFHPYAMVEVDYTNFGKMTFDGTYTWEGVPTEDTGEIKTKGFSAAIIGFWPYKYNISVLGKFGLFRWSVNEDEVFGGAPESHRVSGTNPFFGLGLQADILNRWGVRVEWQHYSGVGKQEKTGEGNINVFGANIYYTFPLR